MKEGEPTPSTSSYRVGGTYTIDKILTPKALSYLKGRQIKKEKADVDDDDEVIIVEDEVLETKKQVVRYIPKVVPEVVLHQVQYISSGLEYPVKVVIHLLIIHKKLLHIF